MRDRLVVLEPLIRLGDGLALALLSVSPSSSGETIVSSR